MNDRFRTEQDQRVQRSLLARCEPWRPSSGDRRLYIIPGPNGTRTAVWQRQDGSRAVVVE